MRIKMNQRSKKYSTLKLRKAREAMLIKPSLLTYLVKQSPIKPTIRAREIFYNKIKQQGR